jgi:hypothetical protein
MAKGAGWRPQPASASKVSAAMIPQVNAARGFSLKFCCSLKFIFTVLVASAGWGAKRLMTRSPFWRGEIITVHPRNSNIRFHISLMVAMSAGLAGRIRKTGGWPPFGHGTNLAFEAGL